MRAPVAWCRALAMAAAVGPVVASPAPRVGAGRSSSRVVQLGRLAEAQDRVAVPVGGPAAAGTALGRLDLLLQRPAGRLHEPALQLVHQPVGVDHLAGVGRDPSRSTTTRPVRASTVSSAITAAYALTFS